MSNRRLVAAVRHLEFEKIAILVTWPISACDLSSLFQISLRSAYMAPSYGQKRFSIWCPSAIFNLKNYGFLLNNPWWELKRTSAYQIWSKSDNSSLRYGDKAIFKMAAVRHLEFSKIAVLVTWPISAYDPSSPFQISHWSANMAPTYSQKKRFSIWRPSAILDLLLRHRIASENCILRSQLCVKFSQRSVS